MECSICSFNKSQRNFLPNFRKLQFVFHARKRDKPAFSVCGRMLEAKISLFFSTRTATLSLSPVVLAALCEYAVSEALHLSVCFFFDLWEGFFSTTSSFSPPNGILRAFGFYSTPSGGRKKLYGFFLPPKLVHDPLRVALLGMLSAKP